MLRARDYQIKDVLALSRAEGQAGLAAHDVGLGKTLVAVDTIRNLDFQNKIDLTNGRVLIIAPLNTHDGWERTLISQFGEDLPIHVHPSGGRNTKKAQAWWSTLEAHTPGVYLVGWEAFRTNGTKEQRAEYKQACKDAKLAGLPKPERPVYLHWAAFGKFEAVIADEVHRICNRHSTTTKTAWTLRAKWKFGLSATPAGNNVEGYWAVAHWLWPTRYPYFWRWANEFCEVERDEYSGRKVEGEKKGKSIVGHFPCYIRRTQEQVIKELPKVIEREILVDMIPTQAKIYRQFELEALAWLEEHPVATPLPIVQRTRLRQVALGVPKMRTVPKRYWKDPVITPEHFDHTVESLTPEELAAHFPEGEEQVKELRVRLTTRHLVEEEVDEVYFTEDARSNKITVLKELLGDLPEGEPVMVYTHSARFIPAVVHQLRKAGYSAVEWSGQTSAAGRARIKADFGKPGGPQVIVAGIAAIGEGVDGLQRVCATEVWLSQHDNNMLNQQAQGRLLRLGQERPVNRFVIKSRDTIDLKVYERLTDKTKEMREVALR